MTRPLILYGLVSASFLASCVTAETTKPTESVQENQAPPAESTPVVLKPPLYPNETPQLRALINQYADAYDVPRSLVQRVIIRESTHRPMAQNGPYLGLMQIHPNTAWGVGYEGSPAGLLDAETNLTYAVKYLRGAWMVADGDFDAAVQWYARGYHPEAKKRGLLDEIGLR